MKKSLERVSFTDLHTARKSIFLLANSPSYLKKTKCRIGMAFSSLKWTFSKSPKIRIPGKMYCLPRMCKILGEDRCYFDNKPLAKVNHC